MSEYAHKYRPPLWADIRTFVSVMLRSTAVRRDSVYAKKIQLMQQMIYLLDMHISLNVVLPLSIKTRMRMRASVIY
jgi:hypothetical protein